MSGWLVSLACMSGAPYVKAPLDGGYTAQLTEELGIYWMDLEPLENCLICWIPTPKAPHHKSINRDFLVAFLS